MSTAAEYRGHHNVSLAYSFPAYKEEVRLKNLPRDLNVAKNLTFDTRNFASSHWFTGDPLIKKFKHGPTSDVASDPLNDILAESRLAMSLYVVRLPYADKSNDKEPASEKQSAPKTPSKASKATPIPLSASKKRIRQDLEETSHEYPPHSATKANNKSPIPNKTIFFSPSGSVKKQTSNVTQSTPKSVLKEAQLNYRKSNQNLNKYLKNAGAEKMEPVDDSDYDHLACHADNILRMAVDSTMLGSSFNGSFSSTFFATGADDSIAALTKKDDDIFHDDDADKSLLEGLKKRWNSRTLATLRATKIEINADDLNKAVNDL